MDSERLKTKLEDEKDVADIKVINAKIEALVAEKRILHDRIYKRFEKIYAKKQPNLKAMRYVD